MESMVTKWYFVTFSSCSVLRRPREQKKEEREEASDDDMM